MLHTGNGSYCSGYTKKDRRKSSSEPTIWRCGARKSSKRLIESYGGIKMVEAYPINLNLSDKLQDREYRQKFFVAESSAQIAQQLVNLRKRRDLSQQQLAELLGTQQPAISRIEKADYQSWSFSVLRKIASVLDARIRVFIEPSEDVLAEYDEDTTDEEIPAEEHLGQFAPGWINVDPSQLSIVAGYVNYPSPINGSSFLSDYLNATQTGGVSSSPPPMPRAITAAADKKDEKIAEQNAEIERLRARLAVWENTAGNSGLLMMINVGHQPRLGM